VFLPQDFSGNYDMVIELSPLTHRKHTQRPFHSKWEVVAPSNKTGITIKNIRGKKYARISPPAEVRCTSCSDPPCRQLN
jgi:hypothetical protein